MLIWLQNDDAARRPFSARLQADILQSVQTAFRTRGVVNVPILAEQVRRRNEVENVAVEDIEQQVLLQAQRLNVVIEFDSNPDGFAIDGTPADRE